MYKFRLRVTPGQEKEAGESLLGVIFQLENASIQLKGLEIIFQVELDSKEKLDEWLQQHRDKVSQ